MTESVPTTCNDNRDAAFFEIADALTVDGFAVAAQIEQMLDDLAAAESWESMALRSVSRSTPHHRELVPVPVIAPRRAA